MKPLDTFFCWQHIITRVAADPSLQSLLEGEGVVHLSLSFSSIRWEPLMVIKRTADHQKAGWAWAVGTKTGNFILFGLYDRDCKLSFRYSAPTYLSIIRMLTVHVHLFNTSKSLGNEANGHDGEGRGGEERERKRREEEVVPKCLSIDVGSRRQKYYELQTVTKPMPLLTFSQNNISTRL